MRIRFGDGQLSSGMGSPVSLAYFDQAPFAFNGTIGLTKVMYLKQ
jgi:arylsulfatase